jgi:hypothetical protein
MARSRFGTTVWAAGALVLAMAIGIAVLVDRESGVTRSSKAGVVAPRHEGVPSFDPEAFMQQSRVGVLDVNGDVRGTIPRSVYWPIPGEEPAPPSISPVTDDAGDTTGYWVKEVGFVERWVVEAPGFDLDALLRENVEARRTSDGQRRISGTPRK